MVILRHNRKRAPLALGAFATEFLAAACGAVLHGS